MVIYCIGNSHVNIFKGVEEVFGDDLLPLFKTYYTGPTIAFNFYEHHLPKVVNFLNNTPINKNEDYILFVIGEVDCRWHLPKQAEIQNRSIEDITQECVYRFFKCYLELKNRGYKLLGWSSHSSTTAGHNDDPTCPVYGDCLLRNKTSKLWCENLEKLCIEHDIPFISIMDELIDENGLTKMEYFLDYCHLQSAKIIDLVIEKIAEKISI